MWSLLPLSTYFPFASPSHTCRNNRWTLGASDIMFTNSVHSKFFNLGQVIETHRGAGIFQEAIDRAVKLLQEGNWVSLELKIQRYCLTYIFLPQDSHFPGG